MAFLAVLVEHAGFSFKTDELERQRVMRAMIESFSGDERPLVDLIGDIIA